MSSYPDAELIGQWCADYVRGDDRGGIAVHDFIARKACDWQREQDAVICDNLPIGNFEQGQYECASAIRNQPPSL